MAIPNQKHAACHGQSALVSMRMRGIDYDAMQYLEGYGWPGNIRELRNAQTKAAALLNFPFSAESFPRLAPFRHRPRPD